MPRLLLAALTAMLALPASAAAATTPGTLERDGLRDIIVIREPGLTASERTDLRADADVAHVRMMRLADTEVVRARAGDLTDALDALNADPGVVLAEPDVPVHAATNDPHWGVLWGLENTGQDVNDEIGNADADIDAPSAWAASTGTGVTVGVVDTGVHATHPDLSSRITGNPGEIGGGKETNGIDDDGNGRVDDWRGWDFVSGDNLPQDGNGHGTHVSGTIASPRDNGIGIAGVAPDARVLPLRVLGDNGAGASSAVADAFDYAGDLGLKVVNASLGSSDSVTAISTAISSHPATFYVVAAGNDGRDNDVTPTYPCNYGHANILCVGATTSTDLRASFSNYGATSVDVFAPGQSIASTYPTNAYVYLDGTSMASPHAAGVAALVFAANGSTTVAQAKAALMNGVDAKSLLNGRSVSPGRINAALALGLSADGGNGGGQGPSGYVPPADTPDPAPTTPTTPPAGDDEEESEPEDGGEEEEEPAPPPPALRVRRRGSTALCRTGCATKAFELRFTLPRAAPIKTVYERRVCKGGGCTWVAVTRRTVPGKSGANTLKVSTKVGARRLGRGHYRVTLQVDTDAGQRTGRVSFTVK
ncbi:MAG: S8 family peptidase [Solirubrobacteraceae bacterium]